MNEDYGSQELNTLVQSIKSLTEIDDELLTEEVMGTLLNSLKQTLDGPTTIQAINQIINNFEAQNLTKAEAEEASSSIQEALNKLVYGEQVFAGNKKIIVDTIMNHVFDIFNQAVNKYHSYSIELPMTVDTKNGAKVPTYAHETDAAADLYATQDWLIQAHTYGNKIPTGVKIQLPEGWLALIIPRSSIGAKTPLRLSNSVGLIDSGYRGELGVLYDNTSDEDYKISAGDRIAQLLVMPSYRFQAKVVDILADSDRGETGFGDSGK